MTSGEKSIKSQPLGMTKKARRVLWYPTQAKNGLEWGTQPLLTVKQSKKVTGSRDDKGEGGEFY
jgi:hypothetical protein